jgi:predicted ATPase
MLKLPSGTVTFLFTDIEGSTRLLRELGEAYADALAEHRRALRDVFSRYGGVEVDTQGDAFFFAFARAKDALAAAEEGQRALAGGAIRVRMGVHTGEPLLTEEGYVGIDVHRAARIAAVGHGGQVLVSQSTRALVGDEGLRDLGEHRLKDLTAPERIYQLGDADFLRLKSLNRVKLPIASTPLVGRRRELAELRSILADGRLVTVTGAGGSGKTRLALQVAAELAEEVRDGVIFVPLAPVQEAALVRPTIVQAAEVRELDELADKDVLVVLDNFEHLLAATGVVSTLLAEAPNVRLLVTSRVRLRVSGEREYALDPLGPEEAVEFFLDRARAAGRDLRVDSSVAAICARLDGLPLALELAASRVKVLDPSLLLERLGHRLPMLTGGLRDAPKRQQTLRATIEWSYGLLEAQLQQAFRRLSVFAGTFPLEASEIVAEADFEQITALVDWSLLKSVGDGRFLMLETIREFARELLERSDDEDMIRQRHLSYFLELVERAEPELTGPGQRRWYDRLALEHDNIREALGCACDRGDAERALMLAGAIWRFWWNRGYIDEASRWYERAFAIGNEVSTTARARGMFGMAHMTEARGHAEQARSQFEHAADLLRAIGETRWLILALTHLAQAYHQLGDSRRSEATNTEALDLALRSGDVRGAAVVRINLGYNLFLDGDEVRAVSLLEEALQGFRTVGDIYGTAGTLTNLATIFLGRGNLDVAVANLRESIDLSRSIEDRHSLAGTLVLAAAAILARGDPHTSARLGGAVEEACRAHGFELDPVERRWMLETTSAVRAALGESFEQAWAAGREIDLTAAAELALRAWGAQ